MFIRSGYSAQARSVGVPGAVAPASDTEHHHDAGDVLVGGRDLMARQRAKAGPARIALELLGADAVKLDHVALGRGRDVRRRLRRTVARARRIAQHAPLAFDHDALGHLADTDRAA